MAQIALTLLLLLNTALFYAQTLRDSVFNNVIKIESENLIRGNSGDYLVDIPLQASQDVLFLFNDVHGLPNTLFFNSRNFLPIQREIILIAPDWEEYARIAAHARQAGLGCIKQAGKLKLYHIKRTGYERAEVDSISVGYKFPQINFKIPEKTTDKTIKVYLQDCYGSACCPEDPKWAIVNEIAEGIATYLKKEHIDAAKSLMYTAHMGMEGEHCTYYTLAGFTNQQKVDFIYEMEYITMVNKATKTIGISQKFTRPGW